VTQTEEAGEFAPFIAKGSPGRKKRPNRDKESTEDAERGKNGVLGEEGAPSEVKKKVPALLIDALPKVIRIP